MSRLNIDSSGLERGARGSALLPLFSGNSFSDIKRYEGEQFPCHFHPEIELTLIMSGEMYYRANDREYHLRAGDAVFVNRNVMHAGRSLDGAPCTYHPVNFWPLLISGTEGSVIEQKYVTPLLRNHALPALVFWHDRTEDQAPLALIHALSEVILQREVGWELMAKAYLCQLWLTVYARAADWDRSVTDGGADAVKAVLSFIEEHYAEPLSLADFSRVAGVSRSELCRTFRRFTGRTAFSYLQYHRVRRSLALLQEQHLSITDVAEAVGFSGGSYYAEVFRRYIGCSPLAYRKKIVNNS